MTNPVTPDRILDCQGVLCPMPVIRLRQEIEKMHPGEVIKVIATDPASVGDMPAFARNTGHELLQSSSVGGVYEYYFRKAAQS